MPDVSVVITTYNKPRFLHLTLEWYLRQSVQKFELVVADDGSGPETAEVVKEYQSRANFPIVHAWQEDKGFRLAATKNLSVRHSTGDYLIFGHDDCLPARTFVEEHIARRERGAFLTGGYVKLDEQFTSTLTPDNVLNADFLSQLRRRDRRKMWHRHFNSYFYNWLGIKDRPRVLGGNLSIWRDDFMAVNGFDETYEGWGREDSDIRTRMRRFGLKGKSIWHLPIVFHLYHPVDPTVKDVDRNKKYYYMPDKPIACRNGFEKLDSAHSEATK